MEATWEGINEKKKEGRTANRHSEGREETTAMPLENAAAVAEEKATSTPSALDEPLMKAWRRQDRTLMREKMGRCEETATMPGGEGKRQPPCRSKTPLRPQKEKASQRNRVERRESQRNRVERGGSESTPRIGRETPFRFFQGWDVTPARNDFWAPRTPTFFPLKNGICEGWDPPNPGSPAFGLPEHPFVFPFFFKDGTHQTRGAQP